MKEEHVATENITDVNEQERLETENCFREANKTNKDVEKIVVKQVESQSSEEAKSRKKENDK